MISKLNKNCVKIIQINILPKVVSKLQQRIDD